MIKSELVDNVRLWSHRTDLNDLTDLFITLTTEKLQRRTGRLLDVLILPDDTNVVLQFNSAIYLYGALRELSIHTHDSVAEQAFRNLYDLAVADMDINYTGEEWVIDLAILNEEEVANAN